MIGKLYWSFRTVVATPSPYRRYLHYHRLSTWLSPSTKIKTAPSFSWTSLESTTVQLILREQHWNFSFTHLLIWVSHFLCQFLLFLIDIFYSNLLCSIAIVFMIHFSMSCSYSRETFGTSFFISYHRETWSYCSHIIKSGSWNSVVSIATRYGMEGPGIESRCGWDFLHMSRPAVGSTQPPIWWYRVFAGG